VQTYWRANLETETSSCEKAVTSCGFDGEVRRCNKGASGVGDGVSISKETADYKFSASEKAVLEMAFDP